MDKVLKIIGGRKVLITILVFISSLILLLLNRLSETDFTMIVKSLIIIYPAANLGQKALLKNIPSQLIKDSDKKIIDNWPKGRKFIFNLVIFIIIAILTGFNILQSDIFTSLSIWLVGVYNTSNVLNKITGK